MLIPVLMREILFGCLKKGDKSLLTRNDLFLTTA